MTKELRQIVTRTIQSNVQLDGMHLTTFAVVVVEHEGNGFFNIRLEADYYGYSGGAEWSIVGDRYETDEELQERLDILAQVKADKKKDKKTRAERERAEYERLKKKFEKV